VPKPIEQYHVLQFDDRLVALAFANQVAAFTVTQQGMRYLADPHRAVIWVAHLMAANASILYVSEGALQAAKALKLSYQATGRVARSELPEGRTLVLGDQSDWSP
jgi:hypothetical protein